MNPRHRAIYKAASEIAIGDPYGPILGRVYDAGYLEGSGQASFTALERSVIDAVLWGDAPTVDAAIKNLRESIIKAELERAGEAEAERRMGR